jgi:beta-galactosidase
MPRTVKSLERSPQGRSGQHLVCHIVLISIAALGSPLVAIAVGDTFQVPENPRTVIPINDHWRHSTSDMANAQAIDFDDSAWSIVDLPHSYNAADGADGGGYYRGIAWYRKTLVVSPELAGKQLYLQFDGASFATDVYIDGVPVPPRHNGGFSRFNYDVTHQLPPGAHLIAVKVDNSAALERQMPPQGGDYTKAGGIYRDVRLLAVDPIHFALQESLADTNHAIASSGIYCTATNVTSTAADFLIKSKLDNQSAISRNVDVNSFVVDAQGTVCWQQHTECSLPAGQVEFVTDQTAPIDHPHLWNARIDPFLYDVYVEIRDHDSHSLVDLVHQSCGIRSFVVDAQRGFLLNGEHYDLHGASAHQDELGKSWARSAEDIRNDIDLMLEMGATVVRTSHYPANPAFYDYADRTGLIVYTEVPINGTTFKGSVPSGVEFLNATRDQMRELIRQNYDHPSIIAWGLFNEISSNPDTLTLIENLQNLTKEEERSLGNLNAQQEPMRRTTAASWNRTYGQLEAILDTVGFNRYYGWYQQTLAADGVPLDFDVIHAAHPTIPIGISEYGAGANVHQHGTMGFAQAGAQAENPSRSQWHPEERQTTNHEQWWTELAARDYLWYKLVWQMFDSASDGRNEGGQKGINDKGLVTSDRKTKKDAYFFYKANWNDPNRAWANEPTLYVAERRWAERTANSVQVKVYSNVGPPTLSLNDVSLGEMPSSGFATYTMTIELAGGKNNVEVSATHNRQRITDKVVWTYLPDLAAAGPKATTPNMTPRPTLDSAQ